uniref:Variant surface glycoprotein 559 n=1 Tax=Trypanosoma brucei TaxID=5691 RepID=M4T1Z7_9TRYP|nr:variant surface glycoprotein 559 [Trypanosoma brucei]
MLTHLRHQRRCIAAVLLLTAASRPAAEAAEATGLKQTAWQPLCQLITELGATGGAVLKSGETILENIKKMRATEYRIAIFMAKNPESQHAKALAVLQAAYGRRANQALEAYRSVGLKAQLRSVRASAYLKGGVDEFLNLLENTKSTTNNKCLVTTAADTLANRAGNTLGGADCQLSLPELKADEGTKRELTEQGFPNLVHGGGATADAHQPAAGTAKCTLLSGHHTNGYAVTEEVGATFTVARGYITIPRTAVEATLANLQNVAPSHKATHPHFHEAWAARNSEPNPAQPPYNAERGDLVTQPAIAAATKKLLLNKDQADPQAITNAIKTVFADTTAGGVQRYLDMVDAEVVPGGALGRTAEATLGQINSLEDLSDILNYFQLHLSNMIVQLKQKLDNMNNRQDSKSAEAACNRAGNSKADCTKLAKEGCVYKEDGEENKKCTLSEEGKQSAQKAAENQTGTDGKTNTTGSNSFVIKKAPLLLAVLLF